MQLDDLFLFLLAIAVICALLALGGLAEFLFSMWRKQHDSCMVDDKEPLSVQSNRQTRTAGRVFMRDQRKR